jgi:hypothetical protein
LICSASAFMGGHPPETEGNAALGLPPRRRL